MSEIIDEWILELVKKKALDSYRTALKKKIEERLDMLRKSPTVNHIEIKANLMFLQLIDQTTIEK